ncbi:MAG: Ig-like domain-containing protein, partial [Proteobacteria bacterium]|nr:Ig-like domain-containing protein [Pseudomonadota bacterium]
MPLERQRVGFGGWCALLFLTVCAVACSPTAEEDLTIGSLTFGAGSMEALVTLGPDIVPGSLSVRLDGRRVPLEAAGEGRVRARTAVGAGRHWLVAVARVEGWLSAPRVHWISFRTPPGAPELALSQPRDGASEVSPATWPELVFSQPLLRAARDSVRLRCDDRERGFVTSELAPDRLLLNPDADLPPGTHCRVLWRGADGGEGIEFWTAAAAPPLHALYDRSSDRLAPLPDDYFAVPDASRSTGLRLEIPVPERSVDLTNLFAGLLHDVNGLDGFSPLAPLVVPLADAIDPASLPVSLLESVDPAAPIALFDLDREAETGPARVAYRVELRDDTTAVGRRGHTLLLFPAVSLRPGGRYGLVLTRRVYAA